MAGCADRHLGLHQPGNHHVHARVVSQAIDGHVAGAERFLEGFLGGELTLHGLDALVDLRVRDSHVAILGFLLQERVFDELIERGAKDLVATLSGNRALRQLHVAHEHVEVALLHILSIHAGQHVRQLGRHRLRRLLLGGLT